MKNDQEKCAYDKSETALKYTQHCNDTTNADHQTETN